MFQSLLFRQRHMAALMALFLVCIAAHAKPPDVKRVSPKADGTPYKVAILPVIDVTGEKDDQRKDQSNAVLREATDQFRQRGFVVVEGALVEKAIADLKLDFTDEETQRRENIYAVGKAVDADLVILSVVTNVYSKQRDAALTRKLEGLGKTKSWFLEVRTETPIFSAYVWEGKSEGDLAVGRKGIRGRMSAAAGNSIRDVLNETLANFPRNKSVQQ